MGRSSNGDVSSSIQGLLDHSVVDSLDSFYQLPIKAKISTILSLHTSPSYQLVGDTNDKAMIRPDLTPITRTQKFKIVLLFNKGVSDKNKYFQHFPSDICYK